MPAKPWLANQTLPKLPCASGRFQSTPKSFVVYVFAFKPSDPPTNFARARGEGSWSLELWNPGVIVGERKALDTDNRTRRRREEGTGARMSAAIASP
eukprot:2058193-Rhodomonas_salina.1